jgi:hypothetical protein
MIPSPQDGETSPESWGRERAGSHEVAGTQLGGIFACTRHTSFFSASVM